MLNIQFEYTAKDAPQQNHLVEAGFTTIAARARAMMSHASLNQESLLLLCKEVFQTTTKLDNHTIINIDGELKSLYEHFGEKFLNSEGSFKHLMMQEWSR